MTLEGGDTSAIERDLILKCEEVGANSTIAIKYMKSVKSLLQNLTSTPSVEQQETIKQNIAENLVLRIEFIRSFKGLSRFEVDTSLRGTSQFAKLHEVYDELKDDAEEIIDNPYLADAYFRNETVIQLISYLAPLTVNASRIAECTYFEQLKYLKFYCPVINYLASKVPTNFPVVLSIQS